MSYLSSMHPAAEPQTSQQVALWWDEAEEAMRNNHVPRARRFLRWILAVQPDDEEAWLRLAQLASDPRAKTAYLRQALTFHPSSQRTTLALREAWAEQLESSARRLSPRPAVLRCLPDQRGRGFDGHSPSDLEAPTPSRLLGRMRQSRFLAALHLF